MSSSERAEVAKAIAKRLFDPEFAPLLTAVAPDGTKPIIPALLSDSFAEVNEELTAAGGSGNVVVPFANGYVVLVMKRAAARHRKVQPPVLDGQCTMGVVIARIAQDSPDGAAVTYEIAGSALAKTGIHVAV